jgi:hypothetical protein
MLRERNPSLFELTEKRICCVGWMVTNFEDEQIWCKLQKRRPVSGETIQIFGNLQGHVTSFELISF